MCRKYKLCMRCSITKSFEPLAILVNLKPKMAEVLYDYPHL